MDDDGKMIEYDNNESDIIEIGYKKFLKSNN
jgi:hypothetical protein